MGGLFQSVAKFPVLLFVFALLFLASPLSAALHPCVCPNKIACDNNPVEEDGGGIKCLAKEDCCSGLCQDEVCVRCLSYGGECTDNSDCCGGLWCRNVGGTSICAGCACEGKFGCGAEGMGISCTGDGDCCSNLCSTDAPRVCIACLEKGKACVAGANTCCNGLSCEGGSCAGPSSIGGGWFDNSLYTWAALAVIMSASFIGLAYMASQLLQVPVLEAWVKIELGELVKSMVIAVLCISLIASVDGAARFLSGDDGAGTVIDSAGDFMKVLFNDGKELYQKLALIYFNVAKLSSFTYTAGTSIGGYVSTSTTVSPASGISPLASEVGQAMDTVANFIFLASSQAAFLRFFATASVVMLPIGIFLRSFSFTRRLGGMLLAAAIAASVVYPTSIMLTQEVYNTFAPEMKGITPENPTPFEMVRVEDVRNPPSAEVVCNPYMQQFVKSPIPFVGGELGWWLTICLPTCAVTAVNPEAFDACFNRICKNIVKYTFMIIKAAFPVAIWVSVFVPFESHMTQDKLMAGYYEPMRDYALPAVAKFSVLSLIVFLIPIIITLSLLRNLSTAFGGDAQLYGLSKLV